MNVFCEDRKKIVSMTEKEAVQHDIKHFSHWPEFRGWTYAPDVYEKESQDIKKEMKICSTYYNKKGQIVPNKITGNFEFFYKRALMDYDKYLGYSIEMVK